MNDKFSKEEIHSDVIDIINESLRIPKDKINISSRLFKDLNAESIDLLDIKYELERKFGININDNEIRESLGKELNQKEIYEKLTVESIITFVNHKLSN